MGQLLYVNMPSTLLITYRNGTEAPITTIQILVLYNPFEDTRPTVTPSLVFPAPVKESTAGTIPDLVYIATFSGGNIAPCSRFQIVTTGFNFEPYGLVITPEPRSAGAVVGLGLFSLYLIWRMRRNLHRSI